MKSPVYQQIKDFVSGKIMQGVWKEGALIPSENELSKSFSVARMTVNRALRELANEQWITRIQGVGSFVSSAKYESTVVEIKSISDEVAQRKHVYSAQVIELKSMLADELSAKCLDLLIDTPIYYSLLIHFENDMPLQLEQRWVNPSCAPDYLAQDFIKMTPNQYLMRCAPLQKVEYQIEAGMPDKQQLSLLKMQKDEPCLILSRRTWSNGEVASAVQLTYPGGRYRFTGSF